MKYTRSFLYLFIIVVLSTNTNAQTLTLSTNQFQTTDTKGKSLFAINNSFSTQSLNSDIKASKSSLMKQNNFDNSYSKYLELSKADTRFNLNFTKVDPCGYSGTGGINLSLIRNGYDPYYYNSNYSPNLFEDMVCTAVKSFLSNLR